MRRAVLFPCLLIITGCAGFAAGVVLHPEPPAIGVLPVMGRVPQYTLQNYDIVHNDALIIVDTDGRIRAIYDNADRVPVRLMLDVIEQLVPGESRRH